MKYQNTSDRDLTVPGVGKVPAGGFVESEKDIKNPHFRSVERETEKPEQGKEPSKK